MKNIRLLFFLLSNISLLPVALSQVSNIDELLPLDGVVIPRTQSNQQQKFKSLAVFKDCDDCPDIVVIPSGGFLMGAFAGEEERENFPKEIRDKSQPQHRVEVRQFAAGKFPVTLAQDKVFVNETGRMNDGCFKWTGSKFEKELSKDWRNPGYQQDEKHPVACISWDDASAYVEWLTQKTGKNYRLLSEAEWEYAARAGTTSSRYWGDDGNMSCAYLNGADQTAKAKAPGLFKWTVAACMDGYAYTSPVGHFQPNQFGLYDMLGNVYEWTQDCLNQNYKGAPSDGGAWTSGDWSMRILRGGSWGDSPSTLRAAFRNWNLPTIRLDANGFRVARDL